VALTHRAQRACCPSWHQNGRRRRGHPPRTPRGTSPESHPPWATRRGPPPVAPPPRAHSQWASPGGHPPWPRTRGPPPGPSPEAHPPRPPTPWPTSRGPPPVSHPPWPIPHGPPPEAYPLWPAPGAHAAKANHQAQPRPHPLIYIRAQRGPPAYLRAQRGPPRSPPAGERSHIESRRCDPPIWTRLRRPVITRRPPSPRCHFQTRCLYAPQADTPRRDHRCLFQTRCLYAPQADTPQRVHFAGLPT